MLYNNNHTDITNNNESKSRVSNEPKSKTEQETAGEVERTTSKEQVIILNESIAMTSQTGIKDIENENPEHEQRKIKNMN